MHSLLHDIPRFLILFLEELCLIFDQMLSIRAFGRRVLQFYHFPKGGGGGGPDAQSLSLSPLNHNLNDQIWIHTIYNI